MGECSCRESHQSRRVVLTGGPGAGKTAVLEMIRQSLCSHVTILPESAGIVFSGGYPRDDLVEARRCAQRAIFHVQRGLEVSAAAEDAAIDLCDRGTLDGLAYWPGDPEEFWETTGSSRDAELARYDAVIHLRTPSAAQGYNHLNPLRTESAPVATEIDQRIERAWSGHPHLHLVESTDHFLDKATAALELLRSELPACCAGRSEL